MVKNFFLKRAWQLILLTCLAMTGCNTSRPVTTVLPVPQIDKVSSSAIPNEAPTITTQPHQIPIISHNIGVRQVDGVGEFYDRLTEKKFVPRGMNYIRLAWQTKEDGSSIFGHSLFDPNQYDPLKIANDLSRMNSDGYNLVRVFLSPDTAGTQTGGLSTTYMNNISDFLKLAQKNQIYVLFTLDWVPGGKYGQILSEDCCTTFTSMNANYLPAAGLKANQAFYQDFIQELINRDSPLDMIFSYELRNEMFYDGDQPPLSFRSGLVTTANGKNYDMAIPANRQMMLDENLVYWIDAMRASIQEVDPSALVSVGFFQPSLPNPTRFGDARIAVTEPAIWQSQADFIDLHPYPGFELSLKQYVENFGIKNMQAKPIIMGEFGALVTNFPELDTAARKFVNWQVESCDYGFDGWIFWTWDLIEQPDFLYAIVDQGQIEKALAPAIRPEACDPGSYAGAATKPNIALNASVTSSAFLEDQPPANAVDGSQVVQWGSGRDAIQWIEINLGQPSSISGMRLTVAQYPAGYTDHQIWVRGANDSLVLAYMFQGETVDNQELEVSFEPPLTDILYVRIMTVQSPSWVAWKEIEVFGQ